MHTGFRVTAGISHVLMWNYVLGSPPSPDFSQPHGHQGQPLGVMAEGATRGGDRGAQLQVDSGRCGDH